MTDHTSARRVAKWTIRIHVVAIFIGFSGAITAMFAVTQALVMAAKLQILTAGLLLLVGGTLLILYRQTLTEYAVRLKGEGSIDFGIISAEVPNESKLLKIGHALGMGDSKTFLYYCWVYGIAEIIIGIYLVVE